MKDIIHYLTPSWWRHLLEYCEKFHIRLHDPLPQLHPRTENDKAIMEMFHDQGYRGAVLRRLNICRMFLKVIFVSEISNGEGMAIEKWAMDGTPQTTEYQHMYREEWPRQPSKLLPSYWGEWRQALKKSLSLNAQNKVIQPMGRYAIPTIAPSRWIYNEGENRIYRKDGPMWVSFAQKPSRTRRLQSLRFYQINPQWEEPTGKYCTIRTLRNGDRQITGVYNVTIQQWTTKRRKEDQRPIKDILTALPDYLQWATKRTEGYQYGDALAQAIKEGTAVAVSDGSYKDETGTFVAVLHDGKLENILKTCNQVPGETDKQSAYRSELAGICGSLTLLYAVCKAYTIKKGLTTVALDGKQAMVYSVAQQLPECSSPSYDLLQHIFYLKKKIPIMIKWAWVKGH